MITPDYTQWNKKLLNIKPAASQVRDKFIQALQSNLSTNPVTNMVMAINRVSHWFGISSDELKIILSNSLTKDDFETALELYQRSGVNKRYAEKYIAIELGISVEDLRKILIAPPAGNRAEKMSSFDICSWLVKLFKDHKNKVRYLVANILIIFGLVLLTNSLEISHWRYWTITEINNLFEFIISIIMILNGIILLFKSSIIYFKN